MAACVNASAWRHSTPSLSFKKSSTVRWDPGERGGGCRFWLGFAAVLHRQAVFRVGVAAAGLFGLDPVGDAGAVLGGSWADLGGMLGALGGDLGGILGVGS